jgi:hypothetical protein
VERIGRSGVGFGGVDPQVLFISSCPSYTGLTGALDRSDRCEPFVGFASGELLNPCLLVVLVLVNSWQFWRCFGWLCVGFFFRAGCVFGGVFVPGPKEVTKALWNTCCAAAVATGLTGSVHRSDWCHRSDRRRTSV